MFGANALTLYITFLVLGVGGRIAIQFGLTGDHGIRWVSRTAPKTAKCACVLLITSFIAILVVSCIEATGKIRPQIHLGESGNIIGAGASLAGIAIMVISQWQMGAAWRFGVDKSERTDLVTSGLYSLVRNPIYSGVFLFCIGLLALLPHIYMLFFLILAYSSIELQVRFVEEPHLHRLHGAMYEQYASHAGRYFPRFIPGSGPPGK